MRVLSLRSSVDLGIPVTCSNVLKDAILALSSALIIFALSMDSSLGMYCTNSAERDKCSHLGLIISNGQCIALSEASTGPFNQVAPAVLDRQPDACLLRRSSSDKSHVPPKEVVLDDETVQRVGGALATSEPPERFHSILERVVESFDDVI